MVNNSNEPVIVEIERLSTNMTQGWAHAMCIDVCLAPNDYFHSILLEPGQSQEFINHFYSTADSEGEGFAEIKFYSQNDPSLSYSQTYYGYTEAEEVVGVEEYNQEHFTLYPVPTDGRLFVKTGFDYSQASIYGYDGRLVERMAFNGEQLDLNHLVSGVYFIQFDGRSKVERFIIR